jgi:TolA-binding protein
VTVPVGVAVVVAAAVVGLVALCTEQSIRLKTREHESARRQREQEQVIRDIQAREVRTIAEMTQKLQDAAREINRLKDVIDERVRGDKKRGIR